MPITRDMKRDGTGFLAATLCLALLVVAACAGAGLSPEEKLLAVFEHELAALKRHEESSYVEYMKSRDASYRESRSETDALIRTINGKFAAMAPTDRESYEKRWRPRFQPVVDEIYRLSRKIAVRATASLTPREMAEIEKFSIRRQAAEKESEQVVLAPRFFEAPEIR